MNLDFMTVYEMKGLKKPMENMLGDVVGVFAQNDTWDVHLFVVYKDGDRYYVDMHDCEKPSKVELPTEAEMEERLLYGDPDDSGEYKTLKDAIVEVAGMEKLVANEELAKLVEEAEEASDGT